MGREEGVSPRGLRDAETMNLTSPTVQGGVESGRTDRLESSVHFWSFLRNGLVCETKQNVKTQINKYTKEQRTDRRSNHPFETFRPLPQKGGFRTLKRTYVLHESIDSLFTCLYLFMV